MTSNRLLSRPRVSFRKQIVPKLLPLAGSIALLAPVIGAEIRKLNNSLTLDTAGSWDIGAVPGPTDIAVWDSTYTAVGVTSLPQLNADESWQGIRVGNVAGALNTTTIVSGFQNTGSTKTLTLGAGGIDMSAATQVFAIQSKLLLTADQTWAVANASTATSPNTALNNGEDLAFVAQVVGTAINLGGKTVTTTGAGTISFSSGHTISNGTFNIGNALFEVQGGASRAAVIDNTVTMNIAAGSVLHLQATSGAITSNAVLNLNGGTLKFVCNNANVNVAVNNVVNVNAPSTILVGRNVANGGGTSGTGTLTLAAALKGSAPLLFSNNIPAAAAGTFNRLLVSGDNSGYSGTITLGAASDPTGHVTRLTTAASGSAAATWSITAGHTLEVDGQSVQLGTLNGAGSLMASSGAATVNVGAGNFTGNIADGLGNMGLTKIGTGALTLSGPNTYTGATLVQGGSLFATPGALGSTSVVVQNGAIFGVRSVTPGTTLTVPSVEVNSTPIGTIAFDLGTSPNPIGALLSATVLSPTTPARISISGAALTAGTFPLISYGTIGGLGASGFSLVLPPRVLGTLSNDAANSLLKVTISGLDSPKWTGIIAGGNWDIDNGTGTGTQNWQEIISSNSTRYLQSAAGADTVRFDDTATGSTTVNLTTVLTPNGITVDNSAKPYVFTGPGGISGAGTLTKTGTGTLRIKNAGVNDFTGATTISGGTLEVGDGVTAGAGSLGPGAITNNGILSLNRPDALTVSGPISGSGSLNKFGLGVATLAGAVTLPGPVLIDAGTLVLGGGGALSGAVSGGGGLTVTGGTLELNGTDANTFTGPVTVSAGTLRLNKPFGTRALTGDFSVTGSGTVVFAQGEQVPDTANITHTSSVNLDFGNQTFANATVTATNGAQLIARDGFNSTGTITMNSGVFSTGSGATNVNANKVILNGTPTGTTLRIAANSNISTLTIGAGGLTINGGVVEVGQGTGVFDATLMLGGDVTINSNVDFNRGGLVSGAKREVNLGTGDRTFTIAANTLTNMRPDVAGNGNLIKAGPGILDLLGSLSYTGETRITAGTLRASTLPAATSALTVGDGATLALRASFPGSSLTVPIVSLGSTTGGNVSFDLNNLGNPTVAPLVATTLTTKGTNTLTVLGSTTAGVFPLISYTGAIGGSGFAGLTLKLPFRVGGTLVNNTTDLRVDVNILGVDTPTWNGNLSSNWDIDDGTGTGTANFKGAFTGTAQRYFQTAAQTDAVIFNDTATGSTNVTLAGALSPIGFTVDNSSLPYTFKGSGKITGAVGLVKNGTGPMILANTVPFENTGATVINGGSLQIGDGTTPNAGFLSGANVTTNSRLVFSRPDDFTFGSKIDGTGDIVKNGAGVVTLNLLPTNSGQLVLNTGTVRLVSGGSFNGVITGPGQLEAAGGTLELFSANTNTGLTTVSAGTLKLSSGAGNAVGGDVLITGSGTLSQGASEQIPDTATLTFTGTSADSMPATTFSESVGNVVVNAALPTGQLIMRNNFTVLGTATVQAGIFGVASLHNATVNKLVITGGDMRIAGSGGPSVLTIGPGGITVSGGIMEVKFNTNAQDATVNLGGDFTATGNFAINNAGYSGPNLNVINLTDTRTFNIATGTTTTSQADFGGPGGLTKKGGGTLTLESISTASQTGPTTVSEGTLLLRGAISGTSKVIISGTGTIAGLGSIAPVSGGDVQLAPGGHLSPGEGIGSMAISLSGGGKLDLSTGVAATNTGALVFDLDPSGVSDTIFAFGGPINIGNGVLELSDFNFSTPSGVNIATPYTLFDSDVQIAGTLAPGFGFIGSQPFQLQFADNNTNIVLVAVPEPSTAMLLLAPGAALLGLRRRRR